MKRECGSCTKCCEGYLQGSALDKNFYEGHPCHFVSIGKGCTVYSKRPQHPCVSFKCEWLYNLEIPEWMKPNKINAIIKFDSINDIPYLSVIEAGEILQSKVLSWLIQFALNNKINFLWQVESGFSWIGSPEFHQVMMEIPKDNFLHLKQVHK